jgi:hypothetical protein
MTTNFGFSPGIIDYWMLLADWRNGSFAILLAVGVLIVGYALATRDRMPAAGGPCSRRTRALRSRRPYRSTASQNDKDRGQHERSPARRYPLTI